MENEIENGGNSKFKPRNTSNANVAWDQIVIEILTRDYTIAALAEKINSTTSVLIKILKRDFSALNFRAGTCILGVHYALFPEISS